MAVAIRQPPPSSVFFISILSAVLSPMENIKSFLLTDGSVAKIYLPSILLPDFDVKNHPLSCRSPRCYNFSIIPELTLLTCKSLSEYISTCMIEFRGKNSSANISDLLIFST